jgi:hypothetical protein
MSTRRLTELADASTLLLAVLVAASGIRLASVAATRALRVTAQVTRASAAPSGGDLVVRKVPSRLRDGGFEDVSAPRKVERRVASRSARPARRAAPRRQAVTVAITAGPPRSEAYFKGRRLGSTPFFGDLDCSPGEAVKIDIVPPKGMPLQYTRVCRPGATLTIAPGEPRLPDNVED